jgi:hypothetical protein
MTYGGRLRAVFLFWMIAARLRSRSDAQVLGGIFKASLTAVLHIAMIIEGFNFVEYLKMVKSILLAAGLALLVAVPEAAIADTVFNYTVSGFENSGGTITPLTGFIDVNATSSNSGTITNYDLVTNGQEFKFSGLTSQSVFGGSAYAFAGNNASASFQILLQDTSTLFSGLTTNIDSDVSGIINQGFLGGTLTIAAVPEPSTWAMMILGFEPPRVCRRPFGLS